ncbi:Septal ring factor EnvC, activator of murein hydrolases AmiA and AmiB [Candidatus Electrothrix aarhusensis]|jgi:septal ring factor EnvC (AmiA/AmiB activator)|uniref:Septal ring factor EnvC, activator of murein hydrolases AmiA and AmiB n=2 Tax=Candidatus Electrothrix TaxID=1859128 RepID=A0A3S3QR65_9BACT|nr:Septal ring factor EnvC, activator of murein hydrolases AmiA and AmiB [Candidatus Electrothrix aarhusensis]
MKACILLRPLLIRLFLPLLCVVLGLADFPEEAVASNEQNKVRIHIGELQHDIKIQLDKIQQKNEAEREILDQLDEINRKLTRQKEKATVLLRRLIEQKKVLQDLNEKIGQAEEKRNSLKGHMLKRLRSFYMMGRVGMLNVTFSKKELPELMLFSDSFENLVAYDKDIVLQYRDALNELEQAVLSRELEKSLLEELVRQSEEEQQVLFILRAEQEQLLDAIKQEKSVYQLAVDDMRQAEQDLLDDLMRLRIEDKLDKEQGLLLGKGRLSAPVTGTVLYRFGDSIQTGLRKGDTTKGITVAIEPGTSVHAVYKGNVVFADYKRGYGNAVIIDHGGNYFTITARLDEIFVHKGDTVEQDQEIGASGDIATLYDPGVYFEIRHSNTPLDPLEWLEIEKSSANEF